MKKAIIIGILLGIVWLGLAILFPYKNKSVKIKELNYASLFNDQNGVQLKSAAQFGLKQPLKNRDAADDVKDAVDGTDKNDKDNKDNNDNINCDDKYIRHLGSSIDKNKQSTSLEPSALLADKWQCRILDRKQLECH